MLAACARTSEQPVAPSHCDAAQRSLRDVVHFQPPVTQEATQRRPAFGAIGDGYGQVGLGLQAAKGSGEHLAQGVDHRLAAPYRRDELTHLRLVLNGRLNSHEMKRPIRSVANVLMPTMFQR